MANLTFLEKKKMEKLLEMGSGYVLDFNNHTFHEFVMDSVSQDIYDQKYNYASGSKANRLRSFWNNEQNHIVGKLLMDLIDYGKFRIQMSGGLQKECSQIAQRLLQEAPVPDIDVISSISSEKDFKILIKSIREAIDRNEPESGLDRLHTFTMKYVHILCKKYGIDTTIEKPLHSLFGEYIKQLKKAGRIESEMTERILKSTISILERFNFVRNNQSLAHDNPILNYNESVLIFNNVLSSIRFLRTLEEETSLDNGKENNDDDEIPF